MDKPKRKAGRPKKSEIEAKKNRSVLGRPPGEAARVQELKARLLATTGERVINKIIEISLTDGHPVQSAALKMCMDRILPVSLFEKDARSGKSAVTINITGLGAEVKEVEDIPGFEVSDVEVSNES